MGESAKDEAQWFPSALPFQNCIHAGVANVHSLGWKGKQTPNWAPMIPL